MATENINYDISNLSDEVKELLDKVKALGDELHVDFIGTGGAPLVEPIPNHVESESEYVIKGENNAWIVLGRDRPASLFSGYLAHTQAGAIDIVVGKGSTTANGPESNYLHPNFFSDAARIHISQKTDIDKNFGLDAGLIGNPKGTSGVGIKADQVRLIGREGIKIVTGKANNVSGTGKGGEKNSLGFNNLEPAPGIELIAGNNTSTQTRFSWDKGFWKVNNLQPIVKGENMVSAMKELIQYIDDLSSTVFWFLVHQSVFNGTHGHPPFMVPSPMIAINGPSMSNLMNEIWATKTNLMLYQVNYLRPFGGQWICSSSVRST